MDPETLETVGRALYGNFWQAEMSRALKVSDRTIRHWASGARPVPPNVKAELNHELSFRLSLILQAIKLLETNQKGQTND